MFFTAGIQYIGQNIVIIKLHDTAILKLAQFQCSLNKSEKSDQPLGQLAPVSPYGKK
jgi:hypothetical protein